VLGAAHYITFDGVAYTFDGRLEYILATHKGGNGEKTFHVSARPASFISL
jgi:hypothetical protein